MPPGPGHDHIGQPSAAAGTDKLVAQIEDAGVGAVSSSHLGRVRLDLMLARPAPHDKPDLGSGSATERHQRAGIGFISGVAGLGSHCRHIRFHLSDALMLSNPRTKAYRPANMSTPERRCIGGPE
jgi:hypothetical protein